MNALRSMAGARLAAARDKARQLYRSHRARKATLIATVVLVVFGLLGFFAAPPIIRGQIEKRASAALSRPVTLGAVHFNPYTLRLQLDRLHIADRDGRSPFVDIDQAVINASWTSLFRRAPVLDELRLQHPRIRIVRTADGRFNFTDLVERYAAKPADPKAPPARFALSNITVHAGDIQFDDQLGKASHHVEQLELGIPFIANLPSDTDVFVQPLLSLRVDGSPLRVDGQTRPFADTRETVMHFQFEQLDLPRYLAYTPTPLPLAIPKGQLGGNLDLHFVQTKPTPQLQLTGHLQLDDFALASNRGEPILELGHGNAELVDVQPLLARYRLGALRLDQARLHYTQGAGGHSNFDNFTASPAPPASTATATPTDLRIASLALTNSAIRYTDATQHELALDGLHGSLQGLSLQPAPAGRIDLAARLGGGELSAKGTLDLAASRLAAHLGLNQVDVAP
ncbi:AsmA family protein, partial [Rhodanobacter thiooxydans]